MSALDGFVLGGATSSLIWFTLYAWAARRVCRRIRSLEQIREYKVAPGAMVNNGDLVALDDSGRVVSAREADK